MNKLYAVAVSVADREIKLEIIAASSKIVALRNHSVFYDEDDLGVDSPENVLKYLMGKYDKYQDIRRGMAFNGIIVAVTKICD